MNNFQSLDPYNGNILTLGLGPILSRPDALRALTYLPAPPRQIEKVPKHIRLHHLMGLRDFHIPCLEGLRLQASIDLMIRQSYRYRDPQVPQTWSVLGGEPSIHKTPRAPAMASVVVGHSGTGKTEAVQRSLGVYPQQVISHPEFPRIAGAHKQVVWLSVDVPASGRSHDLAANLMWAWEATMEKYAPDMSGRFSNTLARERRDGEKMLDEWRQVALGHFLGILHLDEVQNFFKLPTLAKRRQKSGAKDSLELSIIEDQCLKWILTLTNTWQIPIIFSGTPDGVGALTKRFANIQRFITSGYHPFKPFESQEHSFLLVFLSQLARYQFVKKPMAIASTDVGADASQKLARDLADLIIERTAGIRRLIIALWIAAHRVAFERDEDSLTLEDFRRAADIFLAPVEPAVNALRSGNPALLSLYEDLVKQDDNFWEGFWSSLARL
ncbi:MAG: transposase [Betaproteobacteria bacterium HGW-Betaproteobacteria-5]|jgi:hypothetical protein|nr:MAG: transposase [Betaproteobacteria bacterium HGW-Betaproteobacteria-5]PKO38575.1 MAG: transposase [Betaproteobacteria bacterium HGW-Betaproteobacteria-6]